MAYAHRIGADENGLGARLGPLVVTAVLAEVSETGERVLARRLSKRLRADLGDSKELISHGNVALGEAWARALSFDRAGSPAELFAGISSEDHAALRADCPGHMEEQCWATGAEAFVADTSEVRRLRGHLDKWEATGVRIVRVRSRIVCTKRLNRARLSGKNRFISDLHSMEHLLLELREVAGSDVLAVCGKVGGIDDYSKFFGPLSMRLHAVLQKKRAMSAYHFPGLGEVRFLRDADAKDPLVMLASLVGKYVRELLMARVSGFYGRREPEIAPVSGYHDPATARFVHATRLLRKRHQVPDTCFERERDAI